MLASPVTGQRGVCHVTVVNKHLSFCRTDVAPELTGKSDAGTYAAGVVCRDADDDARVGMRGEVFRGIMVRASLIGSMRRGVTYVEPSAVVRRFHSCVLILDEELPKRLIVLREVSLHVALQSVGLLIVALPQGLTDGGNALVGIGRKDLHVARLARPQRDVVQRDFVPLRTAIDDAAHRAVADYQCFLEELRRLVVVQRLRLCHRRPTDEN